MKLEHFQAAAAPPDAGTETWAMRLLLNDMRTMEAQQQIVIDYLDGGKWTLVADFRDPAVVLGAGVHRHVLTNVAIGSHHQSRRPAAIAGRLRW